ncbi:hypothetical protein TWF128_000259 [Orbilia oligospora]|nr:hypothetical protein TWF128_000259 [Orbilia oligospora]
MTIFQAISKITNDDPSVDSLRDPNPYDSDRGFAPKSGPKTGRKFLAYAPTPLFEAARAKYHRLVPLSIPQLFLTKQPVPPTCGCVMYERTLLENDRPKVSWWADSDSSSKQQIILALGRSIPGLSPHIEAGSRKFSISDWESLIPPHRAEFDQL